MTLTTEEAKFADVCARWLADRSEHVQRRTLVAYEKSVRLSLVPALGELVAATIKREHVRAMHLEARDTRGPSAANQALQHGRMVWAFALDEEIVGGSKNPFTRIQLFAEQRVANPLSADAVRGLWLLCESVLEAPRGATTICSKVHAAYFQLVLLTGLRKREATHLRHDEFDRERGVLVIANHKTSRKTGAKVIALSKLAVEHLSRLQDTHRFDERYFFPSARSKRGHIEDPLATWNRVREAAGVAVGTIHDARRGFATTLDAAGATLKQIGQLLGHTSERTTSGYVKPTIATSRAASDLFVASTFGKEVGRG